MQACPRLILITIAPAAACAVSLGGSAFTCGGRGRFACGSDVGSEGEGGGSAGEGAEAGIMLSTFILRARRGGGAT
jgi:hypothetical protein